MHRSILIPVVVLIVGLMGAHSLAETSTTPAQRKQLLIRLDEIEGILKDADAQTEQMSQKLASAKSELDSAKNSAAKALESLTKSRADFRTVTLAVDSARVEQSRRKDTLKTELQKKPDYLNAQQACFDAQNNLAKAHEAVRRKLTASNLDYATARKQIDLPSGVERHHNDAAKTLVEEIEFTAFKTDSGVLAARKGLAAAQDGLSKADAVVAEAIAKDEKYMTLTAAVAAAQTQADQSRQTMESDDKTNLAALVARNKAQDMYDSVARRGQAFSKYLSQLRAERIQIRAKLNYGYWDSRYR